MKKTVVRSLGHAFVLLGTQRARNGILGHTLLRMVSPNADTSFQSFEESEKKLKYATLADEHAKKVKNEYAGFAYACGYLYDVAQNWINADTANAPFLQPLLECVWKHGINVATTAWTLATHDRILISLRKNIFGAGLMHDFGKIGLAMHAPAEYQALLPKFDEQRKIQPTDDSFESFLEKQVFDMSHEEVGSALVYHSKILKELDTEVDFHHNLALVKSRNPDSFLAGAILDIADRICNLLITKQNIEVDDFKDILAPHREYIPLNTTDIYHAVSGLRAKQLLVV